MSSRLEKLLFRISIIDKASGPLSKISHRLDSLMETTRSGVKNAFAGGLGVFGVAKALQATLGPAIEVKRALGELASLGVSASALAKLERRSLSVSMQFGDSARDIVSSSYDIQSAIAGLTGNELARFTEAGAILAKATKSDANTITDFMGTMYGIFQNTANRMGKAHWVQQLAGQTASAVQMFKTTGSEMAASFSQLGAEAQSHGISMAEQMGVLGTLQATMSGSEAGTKYKSFLNAIGKAQTSLGLSFVDSQGKLLPMIAILDRLKAQFGQIDTVAKSDVLKEAFRTKEAVALIKLLMQDTTALAENIRTLEQVDGMSRAVSMASKIADPWERLAAVGNAIRVVFGRVMEPVLIPLIEKLMEGGKVIVRWTELFPNLTRVVGTALLVIFGLTAGVSALAIIGGLAQLSIAGVQAILAVGTGIAMAYSGAVSLVSGALGFLRAMALASAIQIGVLTSGFSVSTAAAWLFAKALFANPITWIVLGVVSLVAAMAMLVKHWDTVSNVVKSFTNNTLGWLEQKWDKLRAAFQNNLFLKLAFAPLLVIPAIVSGALRVLEKIPAWWKNFKQWLTSFNALGTLDGMKHAVTGLLTHFIKLHIATLRHAVDLWISFRNRIVSLSPFAWLEKKGEQLTRLFKGMFVNTTPLSNWISGVKSQLGKFSLSRLVGDTSIEPQLRADNLVNNAKLLNGAFTSNMTTPTDRMKANGSALAFAQTQSSPIDFPVTNARPVTDLVDRIRQSVGRVNRMFGDIAAIQYADHLKAAFKSTSDSVSRHVDTVSERFDQIRSAWSLFSKSLQPMPVFSSVISSLSNVRFSALITPQVESKGSGLVGDLVRKLTRDFTIGPELFNAKSINGALKSAFDLPRSALTAGLMSMRKIIKGFIRSNPIDLHTQWNLSFDQGIRAMSWIVSFASDLTGHIGRVSNHVGGLIASTYKNLATRANTFAITVGELAAIRMPGLEYVLDRLMTAARFVVGDVSIVQGLESISGAMSRITNDLVAALSRIKEIWFEVFTTIGKLNPLSGIMGSVKRLVPTLPSSDLAERVDVNEILEVQRQNIKPPNSRLDIARTDRVPPGGLQSSLNVDRGTRVEKIEVNTTGGVDGYRLADELVMAAG